MVRRLVLLIALALFTGGSVASVSWAKPTRSRKVKKKSKRATTTEPAAGSASARSGDTPMPASAADATDPTAAAAPGSAAAPNAGAAPGAAAPSAAPAPAAAAAPAPAAVPAPATRAAPPAPTSKTLAMRPQQKAHGGFVDDLDCSACHTSDGWGLASTAGASGFDHDRTGFPLRGAHVKSTCSGCHTGKAKPATNCEGCHRDPHQGRNDGTCAECHTAVAWSDTNTLERHRMTRMPLTGRHATVECSACHKRSPERMTSDVPTDCYACHRDDYHDQTIHPIHDGTDPMAAMYPRECGTCHQTSSWKPAYGDPMTFPAAPHCRAARTTACSC
jgi:hypothetical protein